MILTKKQARTIANVYMAVADCQGIIDSVDFPNGKYVWTARHGEICVDHYTKPQETYANVKELLEAYKL